MFVFFSFLVILQIDRGFVIVLLYLQQSRMHLHQSMHRGKMFFAIPLAYYKRNKNAWHIKILYREKIVVFMMLHNQMVHIQNECILNVHHLMALWFCR